MAENDINFLISEQRKELTAIRDMESDLEFAYRLQMAEAMIASLALYPSSSSPPSINLPKELSSDLTNLSTLQTLELDRLQQELKDREQCEIEMRNITYDIKRRVHDQKFAQDILSIPENDWEEFGEFYEKPFGEGSSSSFSSLGSISGTVPFKLYFKGLVSEEKVKGKDVMLAAIGVAICDPKNNLLFNIQKPYLGDWKNHREVEFNALIEGLNAALSLDIKNLHYYCVNRTNYLQITGRWKVKQTKVAKLLEEVFLLQNKFKSCEPFLVAGNDVKFAFKFARDAIDSQITKSLESTSANNLTETCKICYEDTDISKMFAVEGCLHRYCFSCMKQHMEAKVLHGMIPACPHEGCKTNLSLETSKKFMSPKLVHILSQLLKEASVNVTEKVYCPYPKCSTLMSKAESLEYTNNIYSANMTSGLRKCIKCHGLFCINCRVPWHSNMTCHDYRKSNLSRHTEEGKLKSLASQNLWRQCVKCNHMIELAEGCFHMTCRCGYEFCYTCGAEWKNKKQSCSCPLWVEENILFDDEDFDEDEVFDDEYDYEYDSESVEEDLDWRFFR